jgi:uncharacterized protein YcfJ
MTGRFAALKLATVVSAALLSGCVEGGPGVGPGASGPEAELARQAKAMQRTVLEGAATGALLGGVGTALFGGDSEDVLKGALIGGVAGAAAGTYVGHLQRQYASDEDRLERLRADIERTNAESEAAVRNMRTVLEQNRRQLAAARAGARDTSLPAAEAAAERDLANMQLVTAGAERRLEEFQSTRSLGLVEGQVTGVDSQISELSRRIADMRTITGTLAGEI